MSQAMFTWSLDTVLLQMLRYLSVVRLALIPKYLESYILMLFVYIDGYWCYPKDHTSLSKDNLQKEINRCWLRKIESHPGH